MRPTIAATVLADLIAAVPPRLIKRLDAAPLLAESWRWTSDSDTHRVVTDSGETVVIDGTGLRCSCLLAPKCLHVVAVASVLPIVDGTAPAEPPPVQQSLVMDGPLSADQQRAVQLARDAVARLLHVGASAAGAVLRGELLRAAHAARADGLPRMAQLLLALASQLHALHTAAPAFRLPELVATLGELSAVLHSLAGEAALPVWIGRARRDYQPVGHLDLTGLCCEAVVGHDGQAGVVTWMCDRNGQILQLRDVQPGEPIRVNQAYDRGAAIGDVTAAPRALCRSGLLLQNATQSDDGRLGSGQGVRAVVAGPRGWDDPVVAGLFGEPLAQQVARAVVAEPFGAGQLLFVHATVLGAAGPALIIDVAPGVRVAAVADHGPVARDSLRVLGCAPGQAMRAIARWQPAPSPTVTVVAVELPDTAPAAWGKLANVGIDRILPNHLAVVRAAPMAVEGVVAAADPFAALQRRLGQRVLGGQAGATPGAVDAALADAARMATDLAKIGGQLLRALTLAAPDGALVAFGRAWLYADAASRNWQQQQWAAPDPPIALAPPGKTAQNGSGGSDAHPP